MLSSWTGALIKRSGDFSAVQAGDDNGNMAQLPGWAIMVFFCDLLVFAPIFLYIGYTLYQI